MSPSPASELFSTPKEPEKLITGITAQTNGTGNAGRPSWSMPAYHCNGSTAAKSTRHHLPPTPGGKVSIHATDVTLGKQGIIDSSQHRHRRRRGQSTFTSPIP